MRSDQQPLPVEQFEGLKGAVHWVDEPQMSDTSAGVPLPTVAAVLGHAHVTTTALYTTAIGAEAHELVARMWA